MVSREQLVNGVLTYADKEVMPYLPTVGKWGIGTIIVLIKNKTDNIINELLANPIVKMLEVVDCDGMIDADILTSALYESASRYGKFDLTIPLIGNLTFSANDVEKLKEYIIGG